MATDMDNNYERLISNQFLTRNENNDRKAICVSSVWFRFVHIIAVPIKFTENCFSQHSIESLNELQFEYWTRKSTISAIFAKSIFHKEHYSISVSVSGYILQNFFFTINMIECFLAKTIGLRLYDIETQSFVPHKCRHLTALDEFHCFPGSNHTLHIE